MKKGGRGLGEIPRQVRKNQLKERFNRGIEFIVEMGPMIFIQMLIVIGILVLTILVGYFTGDVTFRVNEGECLQRGLEE